jgi:hypothetical protein
MDRSEHAAKLLKELRLAFPAPEEVTDGHTACAEHERREFQSISQACGPQRLERLQEHLLDEIVSGRRRTQVTQAVKTNARAHPATHFGFGLAVAFGNALRKSGVAHLGGHRHLF